MNNQRITKVLLLLPALFLFMCVLCYELFNGTVSDSVYVQVIIISFDFQFEFS